MKRVSQIWNMGLLIKHMHKTCVFTYKTLTVCDDLSFVVLFHIHHHAPNILILWHSDILTFSLCLLIKKKSVFVSITFGSLCKLAVFTLPLLVAKQVVMNGFHPMFVRFL